MLMDVAVMAPVWSADPRAVTHLPTARLEESVCDVWLYVVVELVVTSIEVDVGAVVVVVEDVDGRPSFLRTPSTVKPLALAWVTFPDAVARFATPARFAGNVPPLGRAPPLGRKPPGPRPAPPKAPPVAQLPEASGWLMVTLVADKGLVPEPPDPGVPVAVTQSPTASAEAPATRVCVKAVVPVQLTVT
jgi:hypothetical protein